MLAALASSSALADEAPRKTPIHGAPSKAADGTELFYDAVAGAYAVRGSKHTYWIGERYYRHSGGMWVTATESKGPWSLTPQALVPVSLRNYLPPPRTAVTATLPSGTELAFAPELKVYKVVGKNGLYVFDGSFYRYQDGLWLAAPSENGPWGLTSVRGLPLLLLKKVVPPEDGGEATIPSGEKVAYVAAAKAFRLDGKTDTYLFDGTFYEKRGEKWLSSEKAGSDYVDVPTPRVPSPLRVFYRRLERQGAAGAK